MNSNETILGSLKSTQRKALRVGGVALIAALAGCAYGTRSADYGPLLIGAYLIGYLFVLGWALGSLALLMLQHLTGGHWGATLRRVLEAGSRTLPLVTVLFLPILLCAGGLYEWVHPHAHDELIAEKQLYLNVPFFAVRAAVYFAIWNTLAILLNRWAREEERSPSPRLARRFRLLCGPGLVLYGLTMTFAAIDWAMSLTPHWYSTIYGVLMIVGQGLSAFALAVIATLIVGRRRGSLGDIAASTLADLGSLLLAMVMLWAYMSISQLLIIWSGNLPEEISWYHPRLAGGWGAAGLALVVFHFFVPFFALLQGRLKRNPQRLIQLAAMLLLMRVVDLVWVIGPSLELHDKSPVLLVPAVAVAIVGAGGVWLSFFLRQLQQRPLAPYAALTAGSPLAGTEVAP